MIHLDQLALGLQELLCEGRFVDVRICCSDHSPSDGLGAHRAVLAAASPSLLAPSLQAEESEEEMVCLQLPDFSSACVASVLSILYYGETWLQPGAGLATVNSLLASLGVGLEVVASQQGKIHLRPRNPPHPAPHSSGRQKQIKAEPGEAAPLLLSPCRIKQEAQERSAPSLLPSKLEAGAADRLGSSSSFPLVQSGSLLKCPTQHCNFCALSVPEIQSHIAECSAPGPTPNSPTQYVEVKPQPLAAVKREQQAAVKLEPVDPLERKTDFKAESLEPESGEAEYGKENDPGELEDDVEDEEEEIVSIQDDSCSEKGEGKEMVHCEEENCVYATTSISSFKAHMIMHQRKEVLRSVKRTCPVCKLTFKTLIKLKAHITEQHGVRVGGRLRCKLDQCGTTFTDPAAFYDHVLFSHFGVEYKLKCDQCEFRTTVTSKLKIHLMTHADERPSQCGQCSKSFRSNSKLAEHVNTVHNKQQRHVCTECSSAFCSAALLSKHKAARHSSRPRPCSQCDKTFSSQQGLRAHTRKVHSSEGAGLGPGRGGAAGNTRVGCPVCGKQLLARNLSSHLHYHRQSSLRPFICQECSATFTHAASLKRHALLHTGQQPYVCDQCGKGFFQRVAHQTHMKSHTTERLHCPGCRAPFLTQYLLNFHLKSRPECRDRELT